MDYLMAFGAFRLGYADREVAAAAPKQRVLLLENEH